MFHHIAPILPAKNIQATNLFYRDKLNFDISYFGNYLVVSREGIELFFYEPKDKRNFEPLSFFIFVSNIEDLYSKFSSLEMVKPDGKLVERPGKLWDFSITDVNGHIIRFGQKP